MKSIERGVVLRVSRGVYDHYGVYVGDNQVVHFSSHGSDKGADNSIIKTHMKLFIRDASNFDMMKFSEKKQQGLLEEFIDDVKSNACLAFIFPVAVVASIVSLSSPAKELYNWFAKSDYCFYSKEECATRAELCLGLAGYSIALNNCEQFALWCKIGIHTSTQVNKFIELGIEKSRTLMANDYIPR